MTSQNMQFDHLSDTLWRTDANDIPPDECLDLTCASSHSVETWLRQPGKYYLVSFKGCGRTHLLKAKRAILEKHYENKGIIFIPGDNPYVDAQTIGGQLDSAHINFFVDDSHVNLLSEESQNGRTSTQRLGLDQAKQLWRIALWLSIVSYFSADDFLNLLKTVNDEEIASIIRQQFFNGDTLLRTRPTSSIMHLLALSENRLHKLVNLPDTKMKEVFSATVKSGTFVFIDAGENIAYFYGRPFWVNMQNGLLLAADSIRRENSHVRIYCAFRQEAYSRMSNVNKQSIAGFVVHLTYTHDDLKGLLNHLIDRYENVPSLAEWYGGKIIKNRFTKIDEDVFDYLYRHTIQRPRDFISICGHVSDGFAPYQRKESLTEEEKRRKIDTFRENVDIASCMEIIENFLIETELFLDTLSTKDNRTRLWGLFHSNILTFDEITVICQHYNGIVPACNLECKRQACPKSICHPLCELFRIGLLGCVQENAGTGQLHQVFIKPYSIDFLQAGQKTTNTSPFFLLHPALARIIQEQHAFPEAIGFHYIKGITVGQERPWTQFDTDLVGVQKWIATLGADVQRICMNTINQIFELEHPFECEALQHWHSLYALVQNYAATDKVTDAAVRILRKVEADCEPL